MTRQHKQEWAAEPHGWNELELRLGFPETLGTKRMAGAPHWSPPTDVCETEDGVLITVEIAGMVPDDFKLAYSDRKLIIRGRREDHTSKLAYQQMEIRFGEFETEVYLPWAIEPDKIQAEYENGFLKILLHKARARRVPVKSS